MPLYVHSIDLSAYKAQLAAFGPAGIRRALSDIGEAARHRWGRFALEELHTTQADYLLGLQPVVVGDDGVVIALVGMVPNIVEQGMEQTDLHETLLGPKVPTVERGQRGKHLSKDGYHYRSLSFRHATPGSAGLVAPRMGRAYGESPDGAAGSIGKAIYRMAKALAPSTTAFSPGAMGATAKRIPGAALGAGFGAARQKWGESLSDKDAEAKAPPLSNRVTGKAHSASIYAGMYRQVTPHSLTGHYTTFRTISDAPESQGKWIRPKTPGKKWGEKVAQGIAPLARQILVGLLEASNGGAGGPKVRSE